MIEIIILSIIQGITEFLPISSSAHLIVVSKFFNFIYEVLLHNWVFIFIFYWVYIRFIKRS